MKNANDHLRKTAAKRAPQPQVRGRNRPPRKEVGFDDETLAMLKDLHADGASQSMEESLTRSEVARAAIRAVYAARNMIEYRGVGPRGRWGTTTARALVDDLTESYVRAVGELFVERYQSSEDLTDEALADRLARVADMLAAGHFPRPPQRDALRALLVEAVRRLTRD